MGTHRQKAGTMATSLAGAPPPPPPPQQQQTFKLLWKNSFDKIREKSAAAAGDDDDAFSFRVPEAGALMYRVVAWKKCLTKCKSFSALKKSEGDALEFLTDAWLESALGLPSGAITKIAKKAIGEGLGFLSMTFRLTVAYAADLETSPPTSLILKVPSCYEQSFEVIAEETDCYRREHDFYTEIEPTIAKEACGMRVPKVHKSELVDHGVRILMEDLGPLGFSVNQIDGLTYEQAKPRLRREGGRPSVLHKKVEQQLCREVRRAAAEQLPRKIQDRGGEEKSAGDCGQDQGQRRQDIALDLQGLATNVFAFGLQGGQPDYRERC